MYGTAYWPDGHRQVNLPLVLGDSSAKTESESVSTLLLALGQQVPVELGPSGGHSIVSGPLSAQHNPVSPVLSDVVYGKGGGGGGADDLPDPPGGRHHYEAVEIVDEIDLDPVATENLFIAPFQKDHHWELQSGTSGENYSCRNVSLNSTGNLLVPISVNLWMRYQNWCPGHGCFERRINYWHRRPVIKMAGIKVWHYWPLHSGFGFCC